MEFFHLIKATQKSGKEDAVIWFTAKSEARANLQLDVELEDAGIETGRGKDYSKPVRTDFSKKLVMVFFLLKGWPPATL